MSQENLLEFFIYNHSGREFNPHQGDQKKLASVLGKQPEDIGKELALENIDALLVLDSKSERWYLAYSDSLGIVGQRTARRQADTIARSGFRMPQGYTIKGNYPLDELSEVDIGDLWKTVQQKYVISDLGGLELDDELGIPKQLADRANILSAEGHKDALSDAKLEKEEAEVRKRAMERSGGKSVAPAKTAAAPPKKATKKKPAKKAKKVPDKFLELTSVKQGVIVARGNLSVGTDDPVPTTIIIDEEQLTPKEWNKIALALEEGDVVQLTIVEEDGVHFATSLKM